ncbi:hypothetical protein [Nitrosomonas sp. Nm166]|uniref:hypothetical protein n=1 Tax=Nitrosomonas sp. Nm166 TaxID=1881054 RepID=UPI0008F1161A|nr:hypothetical protein [Nitrosomonas sp. Nm166]SFF03427.1 hypothetical protein SAMN05428977_10448 [Nitrosomonas sp. Nm166]
MVHDYPSCSQCGEYRKVALRKPEIGLCHNCADKTHRKGLCKICRNDHLPLELHHLAGRKHAPNTIPICLNCHAMLSRRQYEWPDLWLKEPCALFLIWGILDFYVLTLNPAIPFEIFSEQCVEAMSEVSRKNAIGPFSLIQIMLFIVVLVWAIKAIPASAIKSIEEPQYAK